ncbi:hypothetical protein SALBM311S_00756 [Streptomyces alboniger]
MAILSVLEISLSFDNAVVNAGILKEMSAFWQKIFLTVGVPIAVFGMRLVFPATRTANELTKRHSQVSLTKQGAADGHLRVNLAWRMRTSDMGGYPRGEPAAASLQGAQAAGGPRATPDMAGADDLDLGCLSRLLQDHGDEGADAEENRTTVPDLAERGPADIPLLFIRVRVPEQIPDSYHASVRPPGRRPVS